MQLIYQSYYFSSKQKNKIILISRFMYQLLRSILFCFHPEQVHYFSMNVLQAICNTGLGRWCVQQLFKPADQPIQVAGLHFRNPVGLAAGFDKNASYLHALDMLGFSHVEIGTVTPLPQAGNEKPRLFRLKKDNALINRMGFNNEGVDVVNQHLLAWRKKHPQSTLIVGGNIGKNKVTPNEEAWKDYLLCFETLYDAVDYFTVNVSSPNTPGLRALQDVEALEVILQKLSDALRARKIQKPVFLKIAPDMNEADALAAAALVARLQLTGMIISNTTISRNNLNTPDSTLERIGAGGLSGMPLKNRAQQLLKVIATSYGNRLVLVGSGGIFTTDDARERMEAGARLIQIWTSFVYAGPSVIKNILKK
ncbi:MAG TPA: quinone-dependent dihydroorotate dehydrogenase [Ferruginibacter sp.]|nr:quinone-dependent dihydroorotate dehydrogenase [Ferruginibacter sp.]HRO16690.1 quinone-dependent dihydroorotate dehydrogenase [Ferruginibacter sp.]HRQ19688.1 quinone-dependent dihydroorotate dehydrogenase [Ferruginibacter sp.]